VKHKGRLTAAGVVLVLGAMTVSEGLRFLPYFDSAGIKTWCRGATDPDDFIAGHKFTQAECDAIDSENIREHDAGISRCVDPSLEIPDGRWQAYVHFAINVGTGKFCRSTLAKRINKGEAACDELSRWTYIAGKDCTVAANNCGGIPKRRRFERQWCETETRPPLSMLQ